MNLLNSILIFAKTILYLFFDSTAFLFSRNSKQTIEKKAIIVRQDGVGDFILWLDTAKEYRTLFPSETFKIILIGNSIWFDLAKYLPYWDEVIPVDFKKFKTISYYRWKLLRKIRCIGAEIAMQPTFSREFYHGDSLVRASGASKKVSSTGDLSNLNRFKKFISDHWYTELIFASKENLTELERNAEFFSRVSLKNYSSSYPKLTVKESWCSNEFNKSPFYILGPGASTILKEWPLANFANLAEKIYLHTGWTGLICGTTKEHFLGEQIINQCNVPLINLAGKTKLSELSGLLSQSQLTIANDTGTAHISSAIGTSTICILGGGHFGRFMPYPDIIGTTNCLEAVFEKMPCYNCNWECIYEIKTGDPAPCISSISVDAVWKKVIPKLNG